MRLGREDWTCRLREDAERTLGALVCVAYESRITGQYHSTGVAYAFARKANSIGVIPDEVLKSDELSFALNPLVSFAD